MRLPPSFEARRTGEEQKSDFRTLNLTSFWMTIMVKQIQLAVVYISGHMSVPDRQTLFQNKQNEQ